MCLALAQSLSRLFLDMHCIFYVTFKGSYTWHVHLIAAFLPHQQTWQECVESNCIHIEEDLIE